MYDGIAMQFQRKTLFYRSPLEPLQQRRLDRNILGLGETDDDTVYGPGPTMTVWVAVLLKRLPFVDATQWELILDEASGYLQTVGDNIAQAINPMFVEGAKPEGTLPNFQLAFVDGRYVTWTSLSVRGFLDIRTGDHVKQLAHPAMESLSYNLTELARRELRRFLSIEQAREAEDAGSNVTG